MITVGMDYKVLDGKGPFFEDAFSKVIEVMSHMPGHTHSRLFKAVDDPNVYCILSEWNDQDAFTAFMRSREFAEVAQWGREQILADRPRHKIYQS